MCGTLVVKLSLFHIKRKTLFLMTPAPVAVLAALYLCLRESPTALPVTSDLVIVHLTDLHLSSSLKETETPWTHKIVLNGYKLHRPCYGKSAELLREAVAVINERIKPDVVVLTGDIVTWGDDLEALKEAAAILKKLACPLIIAKGDHDASRKKESTAVFESCFGEFESSREVGGHSFVTLPYERDEVSSRTLEELAAIPPGVAAPRFLCMHRMLRASALMNTLSKVYCSTLLSPQRERIINALENGGTPWVVLSGHSHTNHDVTVNGVRYLCTASLAEYPHELRVVKVKDGETHTRVYTLKELEAF